MEPLIYVFSDGTVWTGTYFEASFDGTFPEGKTIISIH